MKLSNTSMLLLLSTAGQFATMFASAKTEIQQNFLRKSTFGRVNVEGSANLRRRQEEEAQDDNVQDDNVQDDNVQDDNVQDDDGNSGITMGYMAATKCNSYKVQEDEDSIVEMVLKWNAVYGNGLKLFTAPQKSFVFYDYIDPYAYKSANSNNKYDNYVNVNNMNNNDEDADFKLAETSYIIDLDYWIQTGATLELGKNAGPSCQQIYNPQEIFQYGNNDNDEITKYFATASLKNNNFFEDWAPKIYLGPICGMGDGALNWGIFLDDTCTTYVPKWTYRYRKALAQGHISYDDDESTLLKLSSYTTSKEESSGVFHKDHHWSCEKGNGLCDTLMMYSADTLYCQAGNQEGDEEDEDRRRLEEEEEEEEQEEEEEEAEEEEEQVDDYASYLAYATDDYFANGYQLSQDDMEDIEAECGAVITSFQNEEGTLEEFLKKNGQLKQHTKDYKKQSRAIVEFTVLAVVLFVVVVSAVMFVRLRKQRKRVRQIESAKNGDAKSTKAKKSTTTKMSKTNSQPTKKKTSKRSTQEKGKAKASSKQKKERGGWFSGFRRKKNQGGADKTRSLLDTRSF